ncbi:hypothetical protein [Myroides odoratimimus]|uniref:hypothetical protein n=1 Tax=Myroides odoratimimus TaxID=76832 RepID=UPI002574A1C3|nr:hypothetical protein [Myroides odoratimimus]MDM1512623.1 hypothetical protein [Myroides odoratimimus]
MKQFYTISINPLAEFIKATDAGKKRIIKQQKEPNPVRVSWYQLAKARMKKFLITKGDQHTIEDAIANLKSRKELSKRQLIDRQVSLEALERFVKIQIPNVLKEDNITFHKIPTKTFSANGIDITVSPEIIFSVTRDDKEHYGAIKLRVSKTKLFDTEQQTLIAALIYEYLKQNITNPIKVIEPDLCIFLDVFGDGFKTLTANKVNYFAQNIHFIEEVKEYWHKA